MAECVMTMSFSPAAARRANATKGLMLIGCTSVSLPGA
jgi:hypothetical protein